MMTTTRREWELDILANATVFYVTTPVREARAPGQPMRFEREGFPTLKEACDRVYRIIRVRGRAHARVLVYAATTDGRSCCLSEEDWI